MIEESDYFEVFWDEFPVGEDVELTIHDIDNLKTNTHSNYEFDIYTCSLTSDNDGLFIRKGVKYKQHFSHKVIGKKLQRLAYYSQTKDLNIIVRRLSLKKAIISLSKNNGERIETPLVKDV